MIQSTRLKPVYMAYLIGIGLVIGIPDVVFGLLIELVHHLFEFLHLLFECIEGTLDHVVEHVFHTDRHETQVIVFYLMLTMAAGGLWYLGSALIKKGRRLKDDLILRWRKSKSHWLLYWSEQSLTNKIKLIAMGNAILIPALLLCF
ncbi:hypothetical protein [Methylosarcina fibrata]|uniref:hypothetical protein n=1 Tax=Methylosarcina fibrata TaxID=105972 RepID=UPI00036B690E|nr:hypothetical protein [Methylosarcina fibrata]